MIDTLLKGTVCPCGRHHRCDIQYVYLEPNATRHLRAICQGYEKILIVADENTFQAAGSQVLAALEGKGLKKLIFPAHPLLVPDEAAVRAVETALGESQLIVGIGSGVIQDLCKYTSFTQKRPYLIVATAPSMDGYASDGAAMISRGMKVTYKAGLPLAILADTKVLAQAPMEAIKAGFGDVLGKYSALNDWQLSHLVTGEYYCDRIGQLTQEQITRTLSLAPGLLRREEESVKALMEALVTVGILMSYAGSSRPASGSEHHLSHFFEITGLLTGTPYLSHGLDVAYSTWITAGLRERLWQAPFPTHSRRPGPQERQRRLQEIYGPVAQGCQELQERIGSYQQDRTTLYLEKQQQIRRILKQMPSSEAVKQMLALVGLDPNEFLALYGKKRIADAIAYAKDLKDRYTVLWTYYELMGEDRESLCFH